MIDFDGVGMVDQDDTGVAAVAEKDIGAAADDPEWEFELPQRACRLFKFRAGIDRDQGSGRAADMRGGIVGHHHVFLEVVAKSFAQHIER